MKNEVIVKRTLIDWMRSDAELVGISCDFKKDFKKIYKYLNSGNVYLHTTKQKHFVIPTLNNVKINFTIIGDRDDYILFNQPKFKTRNKIEVEGIYVPKSMAYKLSEFCYDGSNITEVHKKINTKLLNNTLEYNSSVNGYIYTKFSKWLSSNKDELALECYYCDILNEVSFTKFSNDYDYVKLTEFSLKKDMLSNHLTNSINNCEGNREKINLTVGYNWEEVIDVIKSEYIKSFDK